ncbi:MAG: sortase [Acidimicrobiaceae bacterium]
MLCALGALGVLAFAAWELWGTGRKEAAVQQELRTAFEFVEGSTTTSSAPSVADEVVVDVEPDLPGGISAELARARFPEDGDALARLEIPAIELDKFVMRDVDRESLQVGPGHYRGTPRPGFSGNSAIAGHRSTYGAPFKRVDELAPGDTITVHSADGIFSFEVVSPQAAFGDRLDTIDPDKVAAGHIIVDPTDTWVVSDFGDARLTLTACHPEFTSRKRIVVVAELVSEAVPLAAVFGGLDADELNELVTEDLGVLENSAS